MTPFVQLLESSRPVLEIGWLPLAIACAGALLGLTADMFGRSRVGLALITISLGLASVASFATALLPPDALGALAIQSTFGVVLTGAGFAGIAGVVYLTAFLSCGTGLALVAENRRVPLAALIAFGASVSQILIGADDLVVLFIALEALALVAYALVSSAGANRSDEAAMRYFVQGSVVTGLAVLGLAVSVGLGGGVSGYAELLTAFGAMAPGVAVLGVVLFVSVLLFKLGAFPFHSWAPDAYETAPHAAAGFLSGGAKAAAIAALTVFFARLLAGDPFLPVAAVLRIVAVISILFGNLVALRQTSVARMLGYSGVAQAGYALIGVTISPRDALLFASTYAIGATTAFLALEYFRSASADWDGSIRGLAGFGRKHRVAALALTIALFSLTGMPLLAGFWGKFFVFYSAVSARLLWLALIGLAGSVISFGYYGRTIRSMYFDDAAQSDDIAAAEEGESARSAVWPAAMGAAIIVFTGVAPLVWSLSLVYALFQLQ